MKKVSIVVLAYNKLDYTKMCIGSILKYTNMDEVELICVDNGSESETGEYFATIENAKIVRLDQNVGFSQGMNAGIMAASCPFAALISNDVVVTSRWLDQLLLVLESDEKIGIVVPASNFSASQQQINVSYKTMNEMQQFAESYNHTDPRKWLERLRLTLYMGVFRTKVLQEFGGFDPIFTPCYFEDDDLCYRYRRAGYKLIFAADTFVNHFGSVTVREEDMMILFGNHEKFVEKFGVSSWDATELEKNLIIYYDYPCERPVRLLGIGGSCGATLLFLKNEYQRKKGFYGTMDYCSTAQKYNVDLKTICEKVYSFKKGEPWKIDGEFDLVYLESLYDGGDELLELTSYFKKNVAVGGDLILGLKKQFNEYGVVPEGFLFRFEIYIDGGFASVLKRTV